LPRSTFLQVGGKLIEWKGMGGQQQGRVLFVVVILALAGRLQADNGDYAEQRQQSQFHNDASHNKISTIVRSGFQVFNDF